MLDVCLALMPATFFGIYIFGYRAAVIVLLSITASVLSEYLFEKICKKRVTVHDLSAVVTGMLIGLNMPVSVPYYLPVAGSMFAIIFVKQIFGGLGYNFMNPALAARCFLLISFAGEMTDYAGPGPDAVTQATPLMIMKSGGSVSLSDMFFGFTGGCIGETSAVALLTGAVYLLIRQVIKITIPASYIGTVAALLCLFGYDKYYILGHIMGGGLLLGAFFMATDYVTSPVKTSGKIIYGIVIGILTVIFRLYGSSAEGVSYAVICGNILVPLIERMIMYYVKNKDKKKK